MVGIAIDNMFDALEMEMLGKCKGIIVRYEDKSYLTHMTESAKVYMHMKCMYLTAALTCTLELYPANEGDFKQNDRYMVVPSIAMDNKGEKI
eukprot:14722874-Ditylum_brightwellii.AAC.1